MYIYLKVKEEDLWWTFYLSRVYPAPHMVTAGYTSVTLKKSWENDNEWKKGEVRKHAEN